MDAINIGGGREVFWDAFLIDETLSSCSLKVLNPIRREVVFNFDDGLELGAVSYASVVKDENGYKLYYTVWGWNNSTYMAVIESKDGISWYRPSLDIYDHPELRINNVCLDHSDTLFVFRDQNPSCPENEKYKAIGPYAYEKEQGKRVVELWCYLSPDGYHFKRSHMMTDDGHFDSLNTAFWYEGRYVCYYRHFHDKNGVDSPEWKNEDIRDIRVIYSEDFKSWTKQKRLEFSDGLDYPLYTNNIIPYKRAPHMFIGFPVRYNERQEWTLNEEQMASRDIKYSTMIKSEKREGLAVTDEIFMWSRDGEKWHRFNEAFLSPEYENEHNWVYGDSYMSYDFVDSGDENYYFYVRERHRSKNYPKPLARYEIRKDGFACIYAGWDEKMFVTKPIIFKGRDLHLNFSTSAYGYIYVDVLDEKGNKISENSFEIYGDTIDRKVYFADGRDFSEFEGKPIRIRFRMRDAKLYSMRFEE